MAKKLYEEANISAIASAIRSKNGFSSTYTVSEMASVIADIHPTLLSLNVSENGSYTPGTGIDGFDKVVVSVPTAAVALDSFAFTENGTYSASAYGLDGFNVVTISVPSGAAEPVLESLEVSSNGTFTPGTGVDGFSEVVVSVPTGGGGNNLIDGEAFTSYLMGNSSSRWLIISDSLVSLVPSSLFLNSKIIKEIHLPSCSIVHTKAFCNCGTINVVDIPNCTEISTYAFSQCTILSLNIPNCLYIRSGAFQNTRLPSDVSFPNVKTLQYLAFQGTTGLHIYSFPEATNLGSYTWQWNSQIYELYAPKATSLRGNVLQGATNLSIIEIPACTGIESNGLTQTKISVLSLPVCTWITGGALANNKSLYSIYLLSESVATLVNSNAFDSTPIKDSSYYGTFGSIFVPESLVDAYKSASNWSTISDRITAYIE